MVLYLSYSNFSSFCFSSLRKILLSREAKTGRIVFLVCLSYFVFVSPVIIIDILADLDYFETSHQVELILIGFYWIHYSLNFFFYAARCDQFRKAYFYFFSKVIIQIQRCSNYDHLSKSQSFTFE